MELVFLLLLCPYAPLARMVRLAKRLLPHLHEKNIPLIINDRVDVAVMV